MKAVCPECEACVPIKETGKPIGRPGRQGTATYKEIEPHPDERKTITTKSGIEVSPVCVGTGRRV